MTSSHPWKRSFSLTTNIFIYDFVMLFCHHEDDCHCHFTVNDTQVFLLCKQLLFGSKKKVCLKMNTHSPSDTHFPFKERSAKQEMVTHLSSVCFPLCCLYFSAWNRNATRMCRRMLINETTFIKMPRRANLTSCYLCRSNWLQIRTLFSLQSCVPMFMYVGYVAMQATVLIHCISLSLVVCTQQKERRANRKTWQTC